mmetsp:Transcript_11654/g.14533  ORF Transcript_11654/g.14533 Transcript_11654/m.14533 type:complete len:117 (+) Transcript_11654:85-435(+)
MIRNTPDDFIICNTKDTNKKENCKINSISSRSELIFNRISSFKGSKPKPDHRFEVRGNRGLSGVSPSGQAPSRPPSMKSSRLIESYSPGSQSTVAPVHMFQVFIPKPLPKRNASIT